jgi:hypothetical protein
MSICRWLSRAAFCYYLLQRKNVEKLTLRIVDEGEYKMNINSKWVKIILSSFLICSALLPASLVAESQHAYSEAVTAESNPYVIELIRWGIYNDGTHSVETTKGINNALVWANARGITATLLPAGSYLIDKNSRINMVPNMLFELSADAVLTKETNGKERYELLYIGKGIDHVTLKGGTYNGDKATHDYSKKDNKYSSGTHESGYGIMIEGASDVTIDGIKSVNFTGDGLVIGGKGVMITDVYDNSFVTGAIDDKGERVKDAKKVRTTKALDFKNPIFETTRTFELSNGMKLPRSFAVYFYKANGSFLKKTFAKMRDQIQIPDGADHFYLVFDQAAAKGGYFEYWNRIVSKNIVVTNSEFAYNRRQGVTVGGADNVLLAHNIFHDMKGIAPQSGVDVEGGFGENGYFNSNVTIRDNEFYNNAAYDVILFDGSGATVEGNHLASKGVIGVAVSDPFKDARIINNHFDGTRIIAENDATFLGNKMNDSYTTFQGPNITIDGMELTDSTFSVSSKVPFGVSVSNVTILNTKGKDSGFSLWGQPIHVQNMTITGTPALRSITGGSAPGSIFDNLKILGFNSTYGLTLPPGTYNNCNFEGNEGGKFGTISVNLAGKYVFNGCTFKSGSTSAVNLLANNPQLDLTINDSSFELQGNSSAVSVQSAKSFKLLNSKITAEHLTSPAVEIVKVNDYWMRNSLYDVKNVNISGNTISTNLSAIGISTVYAGKGAPSYIVENNTLSKARLLLKSNDKAGKNIVK